MKAVVYEKYGGPEVLELRETDRPENGPKEVLIKVLAASVNKADWYILNGKPYVVRMMAGLTKPKYSILGADVSGIVERIGSEVKQFKIGDEVFGDLSGSGFGGFAEYACTSEDRLAKKPDNFNFEQSAALPMASVTALQGLRDAGKIREGQKVLINGASGGVGSYAIQIAKSFGAEVTAVCSTSKAETAKDLGADHVIDYTKEDFTSGENTYDLIFDVAGNHGLSSISKVLAKNGRYVSCGFSAGALFQGSIRALTEKKHYTNFLSTTNQADLQYIAKLAEDGRLKAPIDRLFTLDDVPEAMQYMGKGHAIGKIMVTI